MSKFNPAEHLMDLKGKQYLQVMWRIRWFRDEHPDYAINAELLSFDAENQHAVFKATISDNNGFPLSTGHGSESAKDFRDFIEKAETKSLGRALAMLGYGTQFAPDIDEGDRIVDSPVPPKKPLPAVKYTYITTEQAQELVAYAKDKWGNNATEAFKEYSGYETTKAVPADKYDEVMQKLTAAAPF